MKKRYLIVYKEGNGYSCSCCRSTWNTNEVEEFEDEDALKEFIKLHNGNFSKSDEARDSKIIAAYELASDGFVYENHA